MNSASFRSIVFDPIFFEPIWTSFLINVVTLAFANRLSLNLNYRWWQFFLTRLWWQEYGEPLWMLPKSSNFQSIIWEISLHDVIRDFSHQCFLGKMLLRVFLYSLKAKVVIASAESDLKIYLRLWKFYELTFSSYNSNIQFQTFFLFRLYNKFKLCSALEMGEIQISFWSHLFWGF